MGLLTKEAILAATDLKFEEVEVPEWGGTVRVRSMTGADRDAFEQAILDARDAGGKLPNVRARLVAAALVDDAGVNLFTQADIEALGAKSIKALDRVYAVASRLNAIAPEDVEALEKNSGAAMSGASTSSSPSV